MLVDGHTGHTWRSSTRIVVGGHQIFDLLLEVVHGLRVRLLDLYVLGGLQICDLRLEVVHRLRVRLLGRFAISKNLSIITLINILFSDS